MGQKETTKSWGTIQEEHDTSLIQESRPIRRKKPPQRKRYSANSEARKQLIGRTEAIGNHHRRCIKTNTKSYIRARKTLNFNLNHRILKIFDTWGLKESTAKPGSPNFERKGGRRERKVAKVWFTFQEFINGLSDRTDSLDPTVVISCCLLNQKG